MMIFNPPQRREKYCDCVGRSSNHAFIGSVCSPNRVSISFILPQKPELSLNDSKAPVDKSKTSFQQCADFTLMCVLASFEAFLSYWSRASSKFFFDSSAFL